MRLLIVEDEPRMAVLLTRGLSEEGHRVDVCADGEAALMQALDIEYDVILLDWMLPGVDGVSVLRRWRAQGLRTPVLLLTARGSVGERVTGLRAGADDYLVKPFDFEELIARIEALHRRGADALVQPRMKLGDATLDARRRVIVGGETEVSLTSREFELLVELVSHSGEVLSRTRLLSKVWGLDFDGAPNVVDVYVGYLRTKIARVSKAVCIETVRGVGYRLVTDE